MQHLPTPPSSPIRVLSHHHHHHHRSGPSAETPQNICLSRNTHAAPNLSPLAWLQLTPPARDEDGVTIDPAPPLVGENLTVTVKGHLLKRVTAGKIDVDLRLMKFIKLTPKFDLCEQLEGDMFEESNVSCPLEAGPVTLIARRYIPEDVPKVSVQGNITLTNQNEEILTCTQAHPCCPLFPPFFASGLVWHVLMLVKACILMWCCNRGMEVRDGAFSKTTHPHICDSLYSWTLWL